MSKEYCEAVECILDIKSNYKFYAHDNRAIDYQCSVIVQALLKSQEQAKALSIIKEKNVDIIYLKDSNTVEEYNSHFGCAVCKLIQEEFELLKKYFND